MEVIEFNGKEYPYLQAQGNAARFAIPFAQEICRGVGLDVGCCKEEWALPHARPVDLAFDDEYHALNLPWTGTPNNKFDYIFSSHCLEHLDDWVGVLDYWGSRIYDKGGIIFLYLPHYSQEYWRPWNCRKHRNCLSAEMLKDYFEDRGYSKVFATDGYDLNNSFYVVARK